MELTKFRLSLVVFSAVTAYVLGNTSAVDWVQNCIAKFRRILVTASSITLNQLLEKI